VLDTITAPTRPVGGDPPAPQPMRALQVANTRRTAVAELKARLRRRELTVTDLVLDPPAELHGYLLFDVLQWAPRYGRPKLRALDARAIRLGRLNLACGLGALTPRQRRWLADQLGGR
jgi:hypothetical protein